MGVRGLTSYIARHAELYLKPYELHDCNLVIDGDNLACNLYRDVTGIYSAFGGDYDDFFRAVVQFFHVLAECNIHAYVLMDGGYEPRKLRTVNKRLRGKISVIKRINPSASITLFPLHMKEVFVDAVKDCQVPIMRCVFEADDELAALARKLNCPVLSYDSDFYIHNVKYIPLITLTVKANTKCLNEDYNKNENERWLRKSEVKRMGKHTKSPIIITGIQVNNIGKKYTNKVKTYKYLDCCIYRVEHLCGRGVLSKEKLPIFAAMLGNDYIACSSFKDFFTAGMGKFGRSRKMKIKNRKIKMILQWLQSQTAESALQNILTRLKMKQREILLAEVQSAISGYKNEICHSYAFFESHYKNAFLNSMVNFDAVYDEDGSSIDSAVYEEVDFEGEQVDIDDEQTIETEVDNEENTLISSDKSANNHGIETNRIKDQQESIVVWPMNDNEVINKKSSETDVSDEKMVDMVDKTVQFPQWFLDKLYPAHFSRYFVDLFYLHKYINNPQIEHFPYNESNEIALPILIYVFTLINNAKDAKTQPKLDDENKFKPMFFTYLTRAISVSNICYKKHAIKPSLEYEYDPTTPDVRHLRAVFVSTMPELNADLLFRKIIELPKDLQLYFLAMVYWIQKSQYSDLLHLHALIICLVVLRTIDATIPAERELKAFQKRFGKIIKKEREVRKKEALMGIKRTIKPALLELSVPERMTYVPKSDCYLVQESLLPHFHMQDVFKKKYDTYSTIVLHAFAEFQSVLYQLRGLNVLLDLPYESPRMGQLYCGVLLYNLYDLLKSRFDVKYYVEHFIFKHSLYMFDFYNFLWDWCQPFVPLTKCELQLGVKSTNRRLLKKKRQAARKKASTDKSTICDTCVDMFVDDSENSVNAEADDYSDLNNKFYVLRVS